MTQAKSLGDSGEDAAVRFLQTKGLKLVAQRFRTRWGEIDAILKDRGTWVFVEVKTRTQASDFPAVESITPAKRKRLINAAVMYMKQHQLEGDNLRFDVVVLEGPTIEWIADAFEGDSKYTL